jgi:copper chaperone
MIDIPFVRKESLMAYSITLNIPAISCGHCVKTIERETEGLPGVISVDPDASSKTATYQLQSEAVLGQVKAALQEIGYPPEG